MKSIIIHRIVILILLIVICIAIPVYMLRVYDLKILTERNYVDGITIGLNISNIYYDTTGKLPPVTDEWVLKYMKSKCVEDGIFYKDKFISLVENGDL